MNDPTENIRRIMVAEVNSQVESLNPDSERKRLEAQHGKVWDTAEMQADFSVIGFAAPFVVVTRKSDNARGTLLFQHSPRFYFSFKEE